MLLDFSTRLLQSREFRFLLVGGFNTVFGYSMYVLVTLILGDVVGAVGSLLIAAVPSTVVAYFLQRRLVWRSSNDVKREATRFAVATAWQTGTNMLLLWLAADVFLINRIFAQAIITVLMVVAIYFIHRFWTFKHRPNPSLDEGERP